MPLGQSAPSGFTLSLADCKCDKQTSKNPACKYKRGLVETIRVELMTSCMSSMRSNQLSYASVTTLILYHIFS